MAFAKDTIKLGAARKIFSDADIQEILVGGKVAGYKATIDGVSYENVALTALCETLWQIQRSVVAEYNSKRAIEVANRIQGAMEAVDVTP